MRRIMLRDKQKQEAVWQWNSTGESQVSGRWEEKNFTFMETADSMFCGLSSITGTVFLEKVLHFLQDLLHVCLSTVYTMYLIAQYCGDVRYCITSEYQCFSKLSWSCNCIVCVRFTSAIWSWTHIQDDSCRWRVLHKEDNVQRWYTDHQTHVRAAFSIPAASVMWKPFWICRLLIPRICFMITCFKSAGLCICLCVFKNLEEQAGWNAVTGPKAKI